MPVWIGLLRGINVGGKNRLSMPTLTRLLESQGCTEVRTYIQSGNVVFASPVKSKGTLAAKVRDAIHRSVGFRPEVVLLTPSQFRSAIKNNPYPTVASEPKSLHFFFLESASSEPDLAGLGKLATETERFTLIDDVFYLHAPAGIGRSKLAAAVERKLGVAVTARNHNTVEALASMLAER